MLIDCGTCVARDHACGDCVITVLLARPPALPDQPAEPVDLDIAERTALERLASVGLIPPLRVLPLSSRPNQDIA